MIQDSRLRGGSGLSAALAFAELGVPPLGDEEVSRIRHEFAELARLAADERSAWLLRRVGIIDVLLRGEESAACPSFCG